MARDFAGVSNLSFGSDATIDNFNSKSILFHAKCPALAAGELDGVVTKSDGGGIAPTGWQAQFEGQTVGDNHIRFTQDFATTDGAWVTADNTLADNQLFAGAITYDRTSTANDPVIYINSSSQALTESGTPVGASGVDAAQNLRMGDTDGLGNQFGGLGGFFVYDNTILTAADVNRHRWWGMAPGGPSTADVVMPMWTNDLANKGTVGAVGNATATGTTMTVISKVERCWGATMGCGR